MIKGASLTHEKYNEKLRSFDIQIINAAYSCSSTIGISFERYHTFFEGNSVIQDYTLQKYFILHTTGD